MAIGAVPSEPTLPTSILRPHWLKVDGRTAALAAGTLLVLVAAGSDGSRNSNRFANATSFVHATAMDEAPSFVSDGTQQGQLLADVRFAAQGWRWSAGTCAWIAVLVRVGALRAVALGRIGGLYGP